MRGWETAGGLFWLAMAGLMIRGALKVDLGAASAPGPGYLPLATGVLLGILALIHLVQVARRPAAVLGPGPWSGVNWRRPLLVLAALFIYALGLERLGYPLATFALLTALFALGGRRKWWQAATISLLVVALTYLLFHYWLQVQFPLGWWGDL